MNLSGLKFAIYDLLGLALPGMFLICEGWIAVRGWAAFVERLSALHPVSFTLFLAGSFVIGHFIQELSDWTVKRLCGARFLRKGRDDIWAAAEGQVLKSAIWTESGLAVGSVDFAFDYCLTRVRDAFPKRDVFLATSDFARSFIILVVAGVAPAWRLSLDQAHSLMGFVLVFAIYASALALIGILAWRRMLRFRYLSDQGVFAAYLGSRPVEQDTPTPNES